MLECVERIILYDNIFAKTLAKCERWCYNKFAKLIKYCKIGITVFFIEVGISLSSYVKNEFDKMQIPLCVYAYTTFAMISLATIGVCVFVRLLR